MKLAGKYRAAGWKLVEKGRIRPRRTFSTSNSDVARFRAAKVAHWRSDNGARQAALNWQRGSRLRGCDSSASCTILIPERSDGAAPLAQTTYAREVIYSDRQFRSVPAKLWPFAASADTQQMPDMIYAIIAPVR